MGVKRQLLLLGFVEAVALALLAWAPGGAVFPTPGLFLFGAAFLAYALAARAVANGSDADVAGAIPILWCVALALRAILYPATPALTDDFWRYLWDGHVQWSGGNPFAFAPAAIEVAPLRTPWHGLINNPAVPTIYPPFAQVTFLFIAMAGSKIWVMKAMWLACDLATAAVLVRIARATDRSPALTLLLYAWAPLLVVEVAWNGHLEPLGLLAMAAALWFAVQAEARSGREASRAAVGSGVAFAAAALTKVAPAAAFPVLARRLGWPAAAAFALFGVVLYLPYAAAGAALFDGLRTYGEHWWFMQGPFGVIEALTDDPMVARRVSAFGVLSVIAGATWRNFDLERALLWIMGAGMLLTPTLHPWYVLWMLPLAALRVSKPWILFGGLAFLGYFGLTDYRDLGAWPQPVWLRGLLWSPVVGWLLLDGLSWARRVKKSRNAEPSISGEE